MLLILIPAMMTAVGVAREKETGSIANFRSTPITGIEFLLGKQLPYVAIGLASFPRLLLTAIYLFGVLVKGSLAALIIGIFHLRRCGDGLRPADLLLNLHSDRRHFHNNDPDPRDRDKFLRPAGPVFIAYGSRPLALSSPSYHCGLSSTVRCVCPSPERRCYSSPGASFTKSQSARSAFSW